MTIPDLNSPVIMSMLTLITLIIRYVLEYVLKHIIQNRATLEIFTPKLCGFYYLTEPGKQAFIALPLFIINEGERRVCVIDLKLVIYNERDYMKHTFALHSLSDNIPEKEEYKITNTNLLVVKGEEVISKWFCFASENSELRFCQGKYVIEIYSKNNRSKWKKCKVLQINLDQNDVAILENERKLIKYLN